MTRHDIAGRRVLVVEDELTVAMGLELILAGAGCIIIGPVGRFDRALAMAKAEAIDAALLDVNLRGEAVFPIADILLARAVPFVFLTGYGRESVPPRFDDRAVLTKPFQPEALFSAVQTMIGVARAGG